jgi:hypothetical protein
VLKLVALWALGLMLVAVAVLAVAYWYSLSLPGESYAGPAPAVTEAERELAEKLRTHVTAIASEPHNVAHYDALEKSAAYIEAQLTALGYKPVAQVFEADGKKVRNIAVELAPGRAAERIPSIVVGAHYDSYGNAPGANDNGSGAAAVIELARLLKDLPLKDQRLRLVLFVNEEPPYDRTPNMGSYRYAQSLRDVGEKVSGMISLETIGAFSDKAGRRSIRPHSIVFSPMSRTSSPSWRCLAGARSCTSSSRASVRTQRSRRSAGRRQTSSTESAGRTIGRSTRSAIRR